MNKTDLMQLSQLELTEMVLAKQRENDELAAHIERFENVILSDRFPDESAQHELLWMVTRGNPRTSLAEYDAELILKARQYCINNFPNGAIHSLSEYAERVKRGEV